MRGDLPTTGAGRRVALHDFGKRSHGCQEAKQSFPGIVQVSVMMFPRTASLFVLLVLCVSHDIALCERRVPYQVDNAGGWTSSIPGSGVGQVFNESPLDDNDTII